jgi:hypothetical protein
MSNNLLRSKQVSPLPVGPGGGNPTKTLLNDTNTQLTMMTAQATANTKYDPPTPQPITKAVIISNGIVKENFSNGTISTTLFVVGGLFIVYGLVAK